MIKAITYTVYQYPLLTLEILAGLERKADKFKITEDDCEFIDHYLTAIGRPPGYLLGLFEEEGVYSFDQAEEVFKNPEPDLDMRDKNYTGEWPAYSIAGHLLGCIDSLVRRVKRGEKIY